MTIECFSAGIARGGPSWIPAAAQQKGRTGGNQCCQAVTVFDTNTWDSSMQSAVLCSRRQPALQLLFRPMIPLTGFRDLGMPHGTFAPFACGLDRHCMLTRIWPCKFSGAGHLVIFPSSLKMLTLPSLLLPLYDGMPCFYHAGV